MKKITIVDYASSNLNVLAKKLKDFGFDSICTSDPKEIEKAKFLLIPGVGHFGSSINQLKADNIFDILNEKVIHQKTPVIGICLGMQLFTKYSEEGNVEGLGWIDASTKLMKYSDNSIKIPHIGWKNLNLINDKNGLLSDYVNHKFYFIHAYEVVCENQSDILSTTMYGNKEFCSSVHHENIIGFQFHPEKSHRFGMSMLAKAINFQMENYGK